MRNIYRLQFIDAVVQIADAGSIRGAAEQMGISQPALTKTLRQFENELGVVLFERTSRGVAPSEIGLTVLTRARAIKREVDRIQEEVEFFKGGLAGQIDLKVSPLAGVSILPPAIARFRQKYPSARINLSTGTFPLALQPLRDGLLDMVVGPIPAKHEIHDLEAEFLMNSEVVLITSARSAWKKARSLADLVDAPWIQIGGAGGPGETFKEVFEMRGLPVPEVKTSSESYFSILAMVEELDAVCSFPKRLLGELGPHRSIVQIPIAESLDVARVGIIKRAGVPFTPAAEHLATWIRRISASLEK
jgi:DNA-binding transcriptional LysR family regulator